MCSSDLKSIVRRLRAARPGIALTTDLIVGFPGETEQDFQSTLRLVEEMGFDSSFSFVYSPRPGTPAAGLLDDTPHEVKLERLHRLQELQDALEMTNGEAMVGSIQSVLVESCSAKDGRELAGRSSNNRMVNFPGEAHLIGEFAQVRITAARKHTLRGELLQATEVAAG